MTNRTNATITRTFIGYNVSAQVAHNEGGNFSIIARTVYVGGNKPTTNAIAKAFLPDTVLAISAVDKVEKLYGISEEDFLQYGVELPPRVEYPSVKARKEAREKASK